MNSAPVLPSQLRRKAVSYIRQSTGHQVMSNQESQRLQHDMKLRALRLGWPESAIEVVEADTGTSGQTTAGRAGYRKLLSELALGEIGIVQSCESTRLSRNCSDWYPLLVQTLLKPCDGLAGHPNRLREFRLAEPKQFTRRSYLFASELHIGC